MFEFGVLRASGAKACCHVTWGMLDALPSLQQHHWLQCSVLLDASTSK
jgi:hypothetical protein